MWLFLISLILLSISIFLFLKTKEKVNNNKEIEKEEQEIKERILKLKTEYLKDVEEKERYVKDLEQWKEVLENNKETMEDSLSQYIDLLETSYEKEEHEYDHAIDAMRYAYNLEQDKLMAETTKVKADLDEIKATKAAAIAALLKEKEINENQSFYTLSIDGCEKREIAIIKSIEDMLRDPRPLRMLIWSTYYLKKANELCSNVLGPNKKTGIYKITSLIDGRCYIGQAIDVKERWREHMKAGLGIDATGSKFYETMQEQGIDNFTFELLEECSKDLLNEKERFYIDLYQSLDYGFNSTKGNKSK